MAVLFTTPGFSNLVGTSASDLLLGLSEQENQCLCGNGGDDRLVSGSGQDSLYGGDGNDFLFGDSAYDYLSGDSGDDILVGGSGDDILSGNVGSDIVIGGNGNDSLIGGDGNDILVGGSGSDCFYLDGLNQGVDSIADFSVAEDCICISVDSFGTSDPNQFSYSNTGALFFDTNGSAPDGLVQIAQLSPNLAFTSSNLVFVAAG